MAETKISVCLSVYNPDENYLIQAVLSIIGQSFQEWEMLLYDDGSDEPGKEIIDTVSTLDSRIRLIRCEEHHSLAYGLNESIKQARGEYIARMDGDDIAHPKRLEMQSRFLDSHEEYMWAGSSVKLIDEKGTIWGEYHYPADPQINDFLPFSPYAHPSVMIRREQLIEHGGYISGHNPCRGEDYELFMRLYAEGARGYNLQEPYLYYRETKDSYKKRKLKFQLDEVGIRYQGFRKLGMRGPKVVPYIMKPLLTAMVPAGVRIRMKQKKKPEASMKLQKEMDIVRYRNPDKQVSFAEIQQRSVPRIRNATYR